MERWGRCAGLTGPAAATAAGILLRNQDRRPGRTSADERQDGSPDLGCLRGLASAILVPILQAQLLRVPAASLHRLVRPTVALQFRPPDQASHASPHQAEFEEQVANQKTTHAEVAPAAP